MKEMGWLGKKNGALLSAAAEAVFDILLTVDKQMRHQQNMANYAVAIFLLNSFRIRLKDIVPLLPSLERQVADFKPHEIYVISL